ncbi:MAG: DUF2147 domain-containing protein [Bacteroidota bacterium]|nr:DUF2147 domain-containing protein [Bacteroidota bacterium]
MNNSLKFSKQWIGIVLLSISMFSFTQNDNNADKLVGLWEPSNGRSRIKVEKIGTKYYGKIVWLKEPIDPVTQKAKLDKNNPDTSMRSVPLKGYRILKDFIYNGKNEWSEGTIYDPENGSTYSCVINMKDDNVLNIRGFIGIKALGRTDVWKKVTIK